ncbi:N-acetyltransferase family protein [Streptomyces chumphonensis]|uniref:GNAT family N-acetyltransferase n=1 Tax=Streptomyces chumphonensis TaxID=1214925 RepID=UPI003D7088F0
MPTISPLSGSDLLAEADTLARLLVDVVADGASVGFLAPLPHAEARSWWLARADAVTAGAALVWVARTPDGRAVGTITLTPGGMPNGRHRADVAKLMVHPDARGRGVARDLLRAAEDAAREAGFTLLVLDTETGSPAERLYRAAGWTEAGTVPDYAADPAGVLRPTTYYYKRPAS